MSGRFDVYPDKAGGWRWRLVARNGRIIADSGEAYTRECDAWRAIERLLAIAPKASRWPNEARAVQR